MTPSVPLIAFAHATGLCGEVWRPVIAELEGMRTISWDFPNHGSAPTLPPPVDWWAFGEWACRQLTGVDGPVIGVGHSMGGAALVMAELYRPGTFAALVLVEPMVLPPPYERVEHRLSTVVRKRRPSFESRAAAYENFASKEPFSTWHPGALAGYLDCALVETDGGEVRLACTPEAEADIYEGATAHGAWERLSEVAAPTLVLAGSASDSFTEEWAARLTASMPRAGFEVIARANHFLPMEDPELVARRIERVAVGATRKNLRL